MDFMILVLDMIMNVKEKGRNEMDIEYQKNDR